MSEFTATDEDLSAAILRQLNLPVSTNITLRNIGVGDGFLGRIYLADIKTSSNSENISIYMCVKTYQQPLHLPDNIQVFLDLTKPHNRECAFYNTVRGIFKENTDCEASTRSPIPACSYANDYILLEYLDGYTVPNFYTGMSVDECDLAMQSLAALHCATMGLALDEPSLQPWNGNGMIDEAVLGSFWENLGLHMSAAVGNQLLQRASSLFHTYNGEMDPSAPLIHGDCWSSNIMVSKDESHAVLLDFQFAKRGRVEEDIASLLCTSLSPGLRREHTQHFLDIYNTALTKNSLSSVATSCRPLHVSLSSFNDCLREALYLIVLSHDTWINSCPTEADREILKDRFAAVAHDTVAHLWPK